METIPNGNFSLGMASWQIFDISCTGFAQYLPILANSCLIFPISCTGLAQYLISQDLAQYLISQHLGEYLISAAQDLPTSSTPASSPQSRSSGNKFVSHTFNKEKNKNWNSFSPLTKWRKEEMKISTGARQLWTVSGALWWKKPGEFSIKFFFCIFLNKLESRSTFVLIVCQDWFFFTRDAGFAGLPGLPASDNPKLPDSANLTSGLNSGPWPVHYKSSKNGSYADMWT